MIKRYSEKFVVSKPMRSSPQSGLAEEYYISRAPCLSIQNEKPQALSATFRNGVTHKGIPVPQRKRHGTRCGVVSGESELEAPPRWNRVLLDNRFRGVLMKKTVNSERGSSIDW